MHSHIFVCFDYRLFDNKAKKWEKALHYKTHTSSHTVLYIVVIYDLVQYTVVQCPVILGVGVPTAKNSEKKSVIFSKIRS